MAYDVGLYRQCRPMVRLISIGSVMKNNDILRRLRYTLDYDDSQMLKVFAAADHEVTRAELSDWLKKEEDEQFRPMIDTLLATFLNGLINHKRGKREGPQPVPEARLTNNLIFTKLKIVFNLTSDDVMALMSLANFSLSKHELSAFFRKPGHKHYRQCKDQILRNVLQGLQCKYRPGSDSPNVDSVWQ